MKDAKFHGSEGEERKGISKGVCGGKETEEIDGRNEDRKTGREQNKMIGERNKQNAEQRKGKAISHGRKEC